MRKPVFVYAKTKTQISFAVTAKLISAFVFATRIVQSLYFLNPKFQASSYLVWLYSLVCVGPGRKPRRPVFSQQGSYYIYYKTNDLGFANSEDSDLLGNLSCLIKSYLSAPRDLRSSLSLIATHGAHSEDYAW